jgi:hypothetical protein
MCCRLCQWWHPEQLDFPQFPPHPHDEPPPSEPALLEENMDIRRLTFPFPQSGQSTPSVPALMPRSFSNLLPHSLHSNSYIGMFQLCFL